MFGLGKVWGWVSALWKKKEGKVQEMAKALLPIVASVALRQDLTGEQKKKAVIDAVLDSSQAVAEDLAKSVLNEAIEVAANQYKIQVGSLTEEKIEKTAKAAVDAGRAFVDKQLELKGTEAQDAGVSLPQE